MVALLDAQDLAGHLISKDAQKPFITGLFLGDASYTDQA